MSHTVTNQYGYPVFFFLLTTVRVDPSTYYTVCVLVQSNPNNFYVVAVYSRLPPIKINCLKRTLILGFTSCSLKRVRYLSELNLHEKISELPVKRRLDIIIIAVIDTTYVVVKPTK